MNELLDSTHETLLDDMFDDLMEGIDVDNFSEIIGTTSEKVITELYSIPSNFSPKLEHGRFYIENYPYITVYSIKRDGEDFEYELEQSERYIQAAETNHMDGTFKQYLNIEKLEGLLYVSNRVDVYENIQTLDEVFDKGNKSLYKMKDGSLKPTYFTGDLYYSLEDAKQVIIKKMKEVICEMETMKKKVSDDMDWEAKSWNEAFHLYPHLAI